MRYLRMKFSSNTTSRVSLLVLLSMLPTISCAWESYSDVEGESPLEVAGKSAKKSTAKCGIRPYDDQDFGQDRQSQVYGSLLGHVVGDLRALNRVVGGRLAVHGEYPWQGRTKVLHLNGTVYEDHGCGAVIISEHWLLSAAHCFLEFESYEYRVFVGDHNRKLKDDGEQEFVVEKAIIHEQFNFDNDIALLKITPRSEGSGIQFNKFVQPACLPESTTPYTEGTKCLISGWGRVRQDLNLNPVILQGARVPLLSQADCKRMYREREIEIVVTDNMVCAGFESGSIDTCGGDSGGPLVHKTGGVYTVYGITSWGVGCAAPRSPGVYVRVSAFLPWIQSIINVYSESVAQGAIPSKP